MRQKISILFIVLTSVAIAASGQGMMPMSLQDCLDYAVKNQSSIKNLKFEEILQQLKNEELTGLTRPQVSFNAGASAFVVVPTSRSDASAFSGAFSANSLPFVLDSAKAIALANQPQARYSNLQFALPYNANCTLSVSQILYDPNITIALEARKAIMELTNAATNTNIAAVKYNVSKAYYNTLIAEKRIASLDNNIKLIADFYTMTSKLFKEGFAEKIDADRLQVQMNNLTVEKNKIENLIAISYQLLKFNMGMPLKQGMTLTDTLNINEITQSALNTEIDYNNRPEMAQLNVARHLQDLDLKRQQNAKRPTVVAFGNVGLATSTKTIGDLFTYKYFPQSLVGLQLSLPVYDGGQRKKRVEQARIKLDQLENTSEMIEQGIDLETTNAKTQLRNSLMSLDNQTKNVSLAEKVLVTSQKKYKEGLGTAIEVMQAQTALKDAETNYLSAMFDVTSANIDLQKALGNLK
jgi:outer membrane protein